MEKRTIYKLVKITDLNGKDRVDGGSLSRIGRIVDFDEKDVVIGRYCFLECVVPGWDKSIITSDVQECIKAEDGYILKTLNSYYYLVDYEKSKRSPYLIKEEACV